MSRVFWLGSHVVLNHTELPRLRKIGFEVFNPAYLSELFDQSTETRFDKDQPTTLPSEIFRELSEYNFFNKPFTERIAELLNAHFDTMIVTNSIGWLKEALAAFRGQIIFRVYGQIGTLSEPLRERGLRERILAHERFWFIPHAEEAIFDEDNWLKERMRISPYTLSHDVFEYQDTWEKRGPKAQRIMVGCPNIRNEYYREHYKFLNEHYKHSSIRIYGVQPPDVHGDRLVGKIPREELIRHFQTSAGYFYTYQEPRVCFLPPVEMMVIGGPVIYHQGSLLAWSLPERGPGLVNDHDEAREKMQRLLADDRVLIQEIVSAQESFRRRYHPDNVYPIFDRVMRDVLGGPKMSNRTVATPLILLRRGEDTYRGARRKVRRGIKKKLKKFLERVLEI